MEFCAAGGGHVLHWEPAPSDDAANPALVEQAAVEWPVTLEVSAAEQRRAGAELVREALTRSDEDSAPPPVDPLVAEQVARWDADLTALLAEAQELRAQDRVVPVPANLSASSLVRLATDPAGLAQDLARPMPRRPAPAARRGTRFHAWVESLFGQVSLIDLDDLDDGSPDDDAGDLAVLQASFLAGPYADRAPLAVEAPFQLVIAGRVISGRIDAVYEHHDDPEDLDDPRFEVVDWKTGQSSADPLQLAIYRLAWAELHDVPVRKVAATFYYVSRGVVDSPPELPDRAGLDALISGTGAYPA